MVLVLHTFIPDGESAQALARWPKSLLLIMGHGWLGVDLFFVLSGFLITGILLDSRNSPHYMRNFYSRRVLRILPVYFICVAVMAYFYPGHSSYFLISLLFLANTAGLFQIAVPHGPGVFWSLVASTAAQPARIGIDLLRHYHRRASAPGYLCGARRRHISAVVVSLRWSRLGSAVGDLVSFILRIQAAIAPARGCVSRHGRHCYRRHVAVRSAVEDCGGVSSSGHSSDVNLWRRHVGGYLVPVHEADLTPPFAFREI
jgi:hypothetical protein